MATVIMINGGQSKWGPWSRLRTYSQMPAPRSAASQRAAVPIEHFPGINLQKQILRGAPPTSASPSRLDTDLAALLQETEDSPNCKSELEREERGSDCTRTA